MTPNLCPLSTPDIPAIASYVAITKIMTAFSEDSITFPQWHNIVLWMISNKNITLPSKYAKLIWQKGPTYLQKCHCHSLPQSLPSYFPSQMGLHYYLLFMIRQAHPTRDYLVNNILSWKCLHSRQSLQQSFSQGNFIVAYAHGSYADLLESKDNWSIFWLTCLGWLCYVAIKSMFTWK